MPPVPPPTPPGDPAPAPHTPAAPSPARTDIARRGRLRLAIARQALARWTEPIEEWRLLRTARRTGRAQRRGSWRRLAHAAASLLLVLGGIVRGLATAWPVEAATTPFTSANTIDGAFDGAVSVAYADLDGDGDLDVVGAAITADDITWWESDGTPGDGGWTTHSINGAFNGADGIAAADLDMDGDLDIVGAARYSTATTWWSNHGGQFTLPTTGTAPGTLNAGQSDDFVKIVFTHNGRTGDNDEELATFQLRFEETAPGSGALTTDEANAIIDEVRVYLDDGSGVFESGTDTLVTTVGTLALDGSGDQIVSFTDGDANIQLPFSTGTRTYFAVLKLTTTYPTDPNRNGITAIRMTHITEASSTAEDRPNDLPLGMAYTANTQSLAGGTTLQGPLAVTINLFKVEPSESGLTGWLLRLGALGAAVAAAWTAWRRRVRREDRGRIYVE